MTNIETFNDHYRKGKALYGEGMILEARTEFLKAAEAANEIAVSSTSYDIRMEYHRQVVKILDFVRNKCTEVFSEPTSSKDIKKTDDPAEEEQDDISPAREARSAVTFADVAGLEEVKNEIRYKVLEPLKDPALAAVYRIEPGAKIMLYGPPGTGKTYIARAIAGEVDAVFYAVNCQDLISKYMGESSKLLNDLFDKALKNERAAIFFDEFDSVASRRGDGSDGIDAEMARFVATFLTKVDGYQRSDTNKMLLLIAATNRPWAIDPAMLRGGRFDTHIYVRVPDQNAREFLVNKSLKGLPKEDDVDLSALAAALEGYGGGDIMSICGRIKMNTYIRALRVGVRQKISRDDCNLALIKSHNVITAEELRKFEKFRISGAE